MFLALDGMGRNAITLLDMRIKTRIQYCILGMEGSTV
jgi:hypothetical protein